MARKVDYKNTCNIPSTTFSMKADFAKRQKSFIDSWEKNNNLHSLSNDNSIILHDGPPYSNGNIHYGHVLNNILKDFVNKNNLLSGVYSEFIPGWDCHGLPIEQNVERKLKGKQLSVLDFRNLCEKEATQWKTVQSEQRKNLGLFGDFKNPYHTMQKDYEVAVVSALETMFEKGLLYTANRPVPVCLCCKTALAESEILYVENHESPSCYVLFDVLDDTKDKCSGTSIVVWTTTPWTLPANEAVAFNPEIEYVELEFFDGYIITAKSTAEKVIQECHFGLCMYKRPYDISKLNGAKLKQQMLFDKEVPLLPGDLVKEGTGTGFVHIAPAHGKEDYLFGKKNNLPVECPVDMSGVFQKNIGQAELKGKSVKEVEDFLFEKVSLSYPDRIKHKYPVCWRCKSPLVTLSTKQWFIDLESKTEALNNLSLKELALKNTEVVKFIPETGKQRIQTMISGRPDWCISRQRTWGIPIPAIHCNDCGEEFLSKEVFTLTKEKFKELGSNVWWNDEFKFDVLCKSCGSVNVEKTKHIVDVWFESGCSWLNHKNRTGRDADIYLEGSDQHRGWFNSSLLISSALQGTAPYKTVLTHGFVVDEEGRPYSKSELQKRQAELEVFIQDNYQNADKLFQHTALAAKKAIVSELLQKNKPVKEIAEKVIDYVSPEEVVETLGSEFLRCWVASVEYTTDLPYSKTYLNQVIEYYKKIRNTFRYLLAISNEKISNKKQELRLFDELVLNDAKMVYESCKKDLATFDFRNCFMSSLKFLQDLSADYLEIVKDWMYNDKKDSERRVSTILTCRQILLMFAKVLAPVLTFTSEDVWNHIEFIESKPNSIFESRYENFSEDLNTEKQELYKNLKDVLKKINFYVSEAVEAKHVVNNKECIVELSLPLSLKSQEKFARLFSDEFETSWFLKNEIVLLDSISEEISVKVKSSKPVCERCLKGQPENYEVENKICKRCNFVLKWLQDDK
jgi:isoleucyl-tRNA synthetase